MKQFTVALLSIIMVMVFVLTSNAQEPDTVMVPPTIDGDPYGALNKFILGDTTETGERVNPNRVYKLELGAIYFLSGQLNADFPLTIIADKPDAEHKPAVITSGVSSSGSTVGRFFRCFDDATFKNIYFQACPPTGQGETWMTLLLAKEGGRYVFDGCYFEWGRWLTARVNAPNTKVFITNCYFRNLEHKQNKYNGRGFNFNNHPVDTLVVVNNTYVNNNSFMVDIRNNYVNYFRFEHNTLVNTVKWPIQWSWPTNAIISNNIFFNVHSYGEAPSDLTGQDYDGLLFGIVNVDTIPKPDADSLGFVEAERKIELRNNCWYYTQEIQDYWNSIDSVSAEPFLNSRTQAMFDDDENYPYLIEENTMNLDPQFTQVPENIPALVQWMKDVRAGNETDYWGWDPDNDRFNIQWPLPEDFSYSTSSPLYTAADGFPVGDLNWFPDKKEEWLTTAIEDKSVQVVNQFKLNQNYPNPFNPTTHIDFQLQKADHVTLTIFNVLGEKVITLVDARLKAGEHQYTWNGRNQKGQIMPSGIYFYKLETKSGSQIRKMMLIK